MAVKRYDAGTLAKAQRLPNGMLRAPALLTRVGVFEYVVNGKIRRELRPPEEVFHADSLESFSMVPVTEDLSGLGKGHPREGEVNTRNVKRVQVGHVGEVIRQDGDHVSATVMIVDAETIRRIDAGKVFLSCGYSADTEETPGEWHGQRYDAIQKNIRGNHVAIVDAGRAGPSARLYLDSLDGVAVGLDLSADPQSAEAVKADSAERATVEKFVIDGIEIQTSKEGAEKLAALRKAEAEKLQAATARADAAEKALADTKARADAAEKSIADAKAAEEKAKVEAAEKARIDAAIAEGVKAELAKKAAEKPIVRVDGADAQPVDRKADFLKAVVTACEAAGK